MAITPEKFEKVRARGLDMLKLAFQQSGKSWPTDEGTLSLLKVVLGVGVAAASEHYAQHPEDLAMAGPAKCEVCDEPVQSWQVGIDPSMNEDTTVVVKVAWPCGHQVVTS